MYFRFRWLVYHVFRLLLFKSKPDTPELAANGCRMLLCIHASFPKITWCILSSRCQSTSYFIKKFSNVKRSFLLLWTETALSEAAKFCSCVLFLLRFQLVFSNYRLDSFHQSFVGHFFLCRRLLERHIAEHNLCIRTLISPICRRANCHFFSL